MTKEELAKKLNNNLYRYEISRELEQQAKENNLVVVFGGSDDLMIFGGAICDEIDCYEGGIAYLDKEGLLYNLCDDKDCPYFALIQDRAKKIEAIWNKYGYSWIYKTDIPHATFDILESGKKYCQGIVFSPDDIDR